MRLLQSCTIITVILAICFAITAPLFIVTDSHDNFILELLETEEENQTEHEESKEELSDDDFKSDFIYSAFTSDSNNDGQFISYRQLPDLIFAGPNTPPPEYS